MTAVVEVEFKVVSSLVVVAAVVAIVLGTVEVRSSDWKIMLSSRVWFSGTASEADKFPASLIAIFTVHIYAEDHIGKI